MTGRELIALHVTTRRYTTLPESARVTFEVAS